MTDEISTKLLSSYRECEVLVVVLNQYDFDFLIKGAEENFVRRLSSYTGNSEASTRGVL